MTVITKPLSEKKGDKLDQPLVVAECLPHRDVETGPAEPTVDPRVLVLRARARRASSVTTACLFMMALLVLCCGILGGLYIYKQFVFSQMHRLRGRCRIPYVDMEKFDEDPYFSDSTKMNLEMPRPKATKSRFLNEEFDIDGEASSYEKITVPNFEGGRSSRFVHDFNMNKTGIIDVEARRCFVMTLNRTQVLPPQDLIDLIRKMWDGYYEVDIDMVRETMRVVLPPIKDPRSVGLMIMRECGNYPIYKMEKIVSGVFKRSVSPDPTTFMSYAGKQFVQLKIANEEELNAWEAAHPRS
ncbi:integral membrane protein 2C-like [Macrosteles quadrilineatus]|uniref:integral membrane protein 2C-like n=1 Tax=Macrosteles quadrilineatus TaxID=74068 RepID=UPI0023E12C2D|nr:integral membrane protein 2C-like [Macrosteles quadrilineatus]XP_054283679.1 integral membrane protein 2C-like [Macrosteles quadrilineatus]